jgi:hypothetical protein
MVCGHTKVDESPMSHRPEQALHLNVDQLAAHLDRRLRGTERDAVVAHLVECAECRLEYVHAGEVLAGTRTRRIGVRSVGIVAAAVLVIAVLPRAFSERDARMAERASTQRVATPDISTPIRLAVPADGERLTGNEVRLAWHPDGSDALYRVTVQTADGSTVWKTSLTDTTVTLPPSVHLIAGATYYWLVDASHADGRPARSAASAFTR